MCFSNRFLEGLTWLFLSTQSCCFRTRHVNDNISLPLEYTNLFKKVQRKNPLRHCLSAFEHDMHFKLVLMISWHKFRWFYIPLTTCFFLRRGYHRDFFMLRGSRLWKTLNRCDLIIFSSVRRHGRTLLFYTKKIAFPTGTKPALSKLSLISNIVKQRDTVGEKIIIVCLMQ